MPSKSTEALSKGIDTSTKNPILFVPTLVTILSNVLFLILAYAVFPTQYNLFFYKVVAPNVWLIGEVISHRQFSDSLLAA